MSCPGQTEAELAADAVVFPEGRLDNGFQQIDREDHSEQQQWQPVVPEARADPADPL